MLLAEYRQGEEREIFLLFSHEEIPIQKRVSDALNLRLCAAMRLKIEITGGVAGVVVAGVGGGRSRG